MTTQASVPQLMTFSALARKLDIPLPRASRLVTAGVLHPDFRLGRRVLFLESRVADLRREVLRSNQSHPIL